MSAVKAVTTLILAAILGVGPVCGETPLPRPTSCDGRSFQCPA